GESQADRPPVALSSAGRAGSARPCRVLRFCNHWRRLLRTGNPRRQFHDPDVAEVDFGAFGFEAEVAVLDGGLADAVDEFAVHGELDDAVHADYVVDVPLALALAAVLDGFAARAARVVGGQLQAVGAEEF